MGTNNFMVYSDSLSNATKVFEDFRDLLDRHKELKTSSRVRLYIQTIDDECYYFTSVTGKSRLMKGKVFDETISESVFRSLMNKYKK